jgi:uncharacterized OsmC-like protein
MSDPLVTGTAVSRLSNQPGRAIVTARGHHVIVDSPAPLGGPNQELNPIDIMLAALATCATFICETAAQELAIPLHAIGVTVAGDFDPRGVCGEAVDPRVQAFRVKISMSGPTPHQADELVEQFKQRCPVYTTFSRAAPVAIEVELAETALA